MNTIIRLIAHYLNQRQQFKDDQAALEHIDAKINALTSMLLDDYFA